MMISMGGNGWSCGALVSHVGGWLFEQDEWNFGILERKVTQWRGSFLDQLAWKQPRTFTASQAMSYGEHPLEMS
jgi:hypothetical protein